MSANGGWLGALKGLAGCAVDVLAQEGLNRAKSEMGLPKGGVVTLPAPRDFRDLLDEFEAETGETGEWIDEQTVVIHVAHLGVRWKVHLRDYKPFVELRVPSGFSVPAGRSSNGVAEYLLRQNHDCHFGGWAVAEADGRCWYFCKATLMAGSSTGKAMVGMAKFLITHVADLQSKTR
ncbi:MAG TPA: hypothetical protein VD866_23620 [Urbifossiella sp.]|nr:hypothetical protein [Urbifossiella sp.]